MSEAVIEPRTGLNPWLRPLFMAMGLLSLSVGVVGAFLPLIPTTGPLLIAVYFFGKSSPRLQAWVLEHPRFGPFVRDFQDGRGISLGLKVFALVAMSSALAFAGVFVVHVVVGRVLIAAVWAWATWFILRVPTKAT